MSNPTGINQYTKRGTPTKRKQVADLFREGRSKIARAKHSTDPMQAASLKRIGMTSIRMAKTRKAKL